MDDERERPGKNLRRCEGALGEGQRRRQTCQKRHQTCQKEAHDQRRWPRQNRRRPTRALGEDPRREEKVTPLASSRVEIRPPQSGGGKCSRVSAAREHAVVPRPVATDGQRAKSLLLLKCGSAPIPPHWKGISR